MDEREKERREREIVSVGKSDMRECEGVRV